MASYNFGNQSELTAFIENGSLLAATGTTWTSKQTPFYYEASSNTVNFGYEINLHAVALVSLLGGDPQAAIVAEVSSEPSGRSVAIKAAASFIQRWPETVLEDNELLPARQVPAR